MEEWDEVVGALHEQVLEREVGAVDLGPDEAQQEVAEALCDAARLALVDLADSSASSSAAAAAAAAAGGARAINASAAAAIVNRAFPPQTAGDIDAKQVSVCLFERIFVEKEFLLL